MEWLVRKLPSISNILKYLKNPQAYCIHSTLSKSVKSHFGSFCPLEVNYFKVSYFITFNYFELGRLFVIAYTSVHCKSKLIILLKYEWKL